MYHTYYPQIVYRINTQESGVSGPSTISVFDGVQFLSLTNSHNNDYLKSAMNMTVPSAMSSFGQENIVMNQTKTVHAIPANQLQMNGLDTKSNNKSCENLSLSNRTSHRFFHNTNDPNKQSGNGNKEKRYNNQSVYNNKQNNKNQNEKQQHTHKQNLTNNRSENFNQNNNYQHHNRNYQNVNGYKRNWCWQNRQRNYNKNVQNIDNISNSSSSSSTRQSSISPSPIEIKSTPKKNLETCNNAQISGTQMTPRKSPTLGEYMLKTLTSKDHINSCSKSLILKKNFSSFLFTNNNSSIANSCYLGESWPDHYGYGNQQFHHNKGFRINHNNEKSDHLFNGHINPNKKRDKKLFSNVAKDHRLGLCYKKTRMYHLALQKEPNSSWEYSNPIGHSIPYSLHNLLDLYNYYNLTPLESLPYYSKNFFVPADRFIHKLFADSTEHIPLCDLTNDKLSLAIWDKFLLVHQTKETYRSKLMLWKYLFLFIKNFHARYSLFLVGSTMTGFASNASDVDFCLIVKNAEIDQRNEAQMHLDNLYKLILNNADDYFKDVRLFPAKVPILRFHDTAQNLDVDLNCNNFVGIRNTHLLHCYNQMNWRLRPLVILVKQWARGNQMNSARESTISSYSLTLMVIHYLQCGVKPPILPCLHALYPAKFEYYFDIHTIDIHEKLEPYRTDNNQSLGELLLGFFEYYANFDYATWAISIRLAKLLKIEDCKNIQMPKNDPTQWLYICIEEPFDRTNTARSVYLYNMFLYIKSVFHLSYKKLKQTGDLDKIMDLGLSVPDLHSSTPPPKNASFVRTELKKPKYRNVCCISSENPEQKIEISGC